MDEGKPIRSFGLGAEELAILKPLPLLTTKPAVYIGGVTEDGFENNSHFDCLKGLVEKEDAPAAAVYAMVESEVAKLEDNEKVEFLAEMGLKRPGLSHLIRAGYNLLGLQTHFIINVKEVYV